MRHHHQNTYHLNRLYRIIFINEIIKIIKIIINSLHLIIKNLIISKVIINKGIIRRVIIRKVIIRKITIHKEL